MKFTDLEEESRIQLVDRLLLHVRTDNYEAFCSAVDKAYLWFGQEKLSYIMRNDLLKKIYECNELETFLKWGEKLDNV